MGKFEQDGETGSKHLLQCGWYDLPENNPIVKFCQDSGLHGLKYITGPKQHLFERIFWLVAFTLAAIAGGVLIFKTWEQYKNLPVIIIQSPKQLTLEEFPFPSVTVCGLNRVRKETYDKYVNLAHFADDVEYVNSNSTIVQDAKDIVKILDALCEPGNIFSKSMLWKDRQMYGMGVQSAFLNLELSSSFRNESRIMKLLQESSHDCGDLMPAIAWAHGYWDSFMAFEKVETDFGICCTFNTIPVIDLKPWRAISAKNLELENQIFYHDNPWENDSVSADALIFTEETQHRAHPFRQRVPGIGPGLSFPLVTKMDEYHCKSPDLEGFLVSIGNPLDGASTHDRENFVEFNTEVFFTLRPQLTLADDSTKSFTPEKRGCYFANELSLKDFSVYTQSNCVHECIANLTLTNCLHVASCWENDWIYEHVCKPTGNCSVHAVDKAFTTGSEEACKHCLPSCTDIKYEYDMEVKYLRDDYIKKLEEHPWFGVPGNKSIVHVFFDEYYTTPKIRKEQFGILELLANSGGLLGLCLGFSGISILEILYYFTIRVCFRQYRRKVLLKKQYNGVPQNDTLIHKDSDNTDNTFQHLDQVEMEENHSNSKQMQERIAKLEQIVGELTTKSC